MPTTPRYLSPDDGAPSLPLPGLRPGVALIGEGADAELRDLRLGQVVKLGEVATVIVSLLDGTRDAELLLRDAQIALGEELNPLGLVELLQALDRRALLDTPRARMVVAQGLVRADIAALQRLAKRTRPLRSISSDAMRAAPSDQEPHTAPGTTFTCGSCNRCCSEHHLLGPVTRVERDRILKSFSDLGDARGADPSNFLPLPTGDGRELYLLRTREGFCSYLGADGLCRVHKEIGIDAKPAVCRMFPYRMVHTPSGWDTGLSLSCPTVASGGGDDAKVEAREKLGSLPIFGSMLTEVPASMPLAEQVRCTWGDYRKWESAAIALIQDESRDPADAWVEAVKRLALLGRTLDTSAFGAETTTELHVASAAPPEKAGTDELVPDLGLGDCPLSAAEAADVLLRDMALWSELLVGLEAADPDALRRLRSGLLRLRKGVDFAPDAAPVLAEDARLRNRLQTAAMGQQIEDPFEDTVPEAPLASTDDPSVQRRFLVQALMEKRLFEFGNLLRGTTILSVMLGVMRLPARPNDELQAQIGDLAYLVHHPQLADILDSRALVRASSDDVEFHAALLGVEITSY